VSLASKLNELRQRAGKSLQEVATAVGVSKTHIWALEKGKSENPSLDLVNKLASLFNVPTDYLLGTSVKSTWAGEAEAVQFLRKFQQLGVEEQRALQLTLEAFLKQKLTKDDAG
jgi:transcriptional regulator with XRE-family HTH domain